MRRQVHPPATKQNRASETMPHPEMERLSNGAQETSRRVEQDGPSSIGDFDTFLRQYVAPSTEMKQP